MSYPVEPFGPIDDTHTTQHPGYPETAITWALEPVAHVADPRVLDLGAGTGKLTEAVLGVTGNVIAVEPDPGMRTEFVSRVLGACVLAGTVKAIPLPDERVHAVLIGTDRHWSDISRSVGEISRVLVPGGVVAAFWNPPGPTAGWLAEFDRYQERGFDNVTGGDHVRLRGTDAARSQPPRVTVGRAVRTAGTG